MGLNQYRSILVLPVFLATCLLGLGCSMQPVTPTGFLSDYGTLRPREDLTLYYSDPPKEADRPTHVIFLGKAQLRPDEGMDIAFGQEMCGVLATRLRMRILQQVKGSVLVLEKESELAPYRNMPGVGTMVVDYAITHIGEGFGLSRYMLGFGLGDARVTVEAKATLATLGKESTHQMVVYARSHGNPYGGLNPRSLFTRYSVRLACDGAAVKLAQHLSERIVKPEAGWWE